MKNRFFLLLFAALFAFSPVAAQGINNPGVGPTIPWSCTIAGDVTPGTPTYTTQVCYYTKVGREIIAHFTIQTSNVTGMVGNLQICGLPLPSTAVTGDIGMVTFGLYSGITASGDGQMGGDVLVGTSCGRVGTMNLTTAAVTLVPVAGLAAGGILIRGTIFYHSVS